MRVIFLGTPLFAIPTLEALYKNHDVVGVVTQPDRPRGRGGKVTPSPVKARAIELGLPVYQFEKIGKEGVEILRALNADIMVTAAYGQILTDELLTLTPHGVVNVHGSILPRYRGSSPVHHAILAGESETGVTIMQTAREVDSGDIILIKKTPIGEKEGTSVILERLSIIGAEALIESLINIENGVATRTKQAHADATFCKMLTKQDGVIDWSQSATCVARKIRAFDQGGATTTLRGQICKLFIPTVVGLKGEPGEVIVCSDKDGITVACGEGSVCIGEILPAGAKRIKTTDFVRGRKINQGDFFGK